MNLFKNTHTYTRTINLMYNPDEYAKQINQICEIFEYANCDPMKLTLDERKRWLYNLEAEYKQRRGKEFVYKEEVKNFENYENVTEIEEVEDDDIVFSTPTSSPPPYSLGNPDDLYQNNPLFNTNLGNNINDDKKIDDDEFWNLNDFLDDVDNNNNNTTNEIINNKIKSGIYNEYDHKNNEHKNNETQYNEYIKNEEQWWNESDFEDLYA